MAMRTIMEIEHKVKMNALYEEKQIDLRERLMKIRKAKLNADIDLQVANINNNKLLSEDSQDAEETSRYCLLPANIQKMV